MAGIDEVLERLVADGDFRAALARDPAATLAGYDLTRDDIELLASRLDDGDDAERTVEQRTSKSAMLALLSSLAGPGGGGAADPGQDRIDLLSWDWGETHGDDTVPDDLAVPDDAADELYNKSKGNVEYSWKVEEGVKGVVEMDDLTHKVEPGEDVEFDYNKVDVEAEPLEPAAAEQLGSTPPEDSNVGGATPDDDVVGGIPPDDGVEATPHQDDMLGARRDATEAVEADDVLEIEDV